MNNERVRLVVIDDISTIVEGIASAVPWKEHGIEVVGTAANGEAGWALIQDQRPDIVLTDIRMPRMSGLELARKLFTEQTDRKVILLSGYADFAYAQEAIRLGAFDFIKKPFSLDEILQIVLKAKDAVLESRRQASYYSRMEAKLKESLPLLKQEYFTLLLHHDTSSLEAEQRWAFLGVDLMPEHFIIMLAEIDNFEQLTMNKAVKELELIRFSLQNVLEETVQSYTKGIVFRETLKRFAIIMNAPEQITAVELAEKCCSNVLRHTRHSLSIGLGDEARTLHDLKQAYHQAVMALSYHFYTGGNAALAYNGIRESESSHISLSLLVDVDPLLFALRSGNKQRVLDLLEQMNEQLSQLTPLPNPAEMQSLFTELADQMRKTVRHLDSLENESMLLHAQWNESIRSPQLGQLQALQKELRLFAVRICERIEAERISASDLIIHQSMAYIRTHLNEELTVSGCAANVHLSGSYFSNLFKKITGLSVMQFVTRERIVRAKELLLDNKPVQDVAAMVGYTDRRSFSEAFKRQTGLNPTEYKQAASDDH